MKQLQYLNNLIDLPLFKKTNSFFYVKIQFANYCMDFIISVVSI